MISGLHLGISSAEGHLVKAGVYPSIRGAARVEIGFYSQDQASVFIESSARAEDQGETELRLFVHYAVRQLGEPGQ